MPTFAATFTHPEELNTLMEALQHASIMEEHRTLMGVVIEKVQSAKSGVNEAVTSLLTCLELCDVIFLTAFHMKKMIVYR